MDTTKWGICNESFLGHEQLQRRLESECNRDSKEEANKLALEKKILAIQVKENSDKQRLVKSRYLSMVKQSSKLKLPSATEQQEMMKRRRESVVKRKKKSGT